jgi:hypothetical protein
VSSEWHGSGAALVYGNQGHKASFYVTNFPDKMPLFRLRQAFEVCGMLSDVYVARHCNARGQEFGFVRYVNVKNSDKLLQALNNVWVEDCRIWATEVKYDRFARNNVVVSPSRAGVRKELVVDKVGGSKAVGRGNKPSAADKKVEGDCDVTVGAVSVPVGKVVIKPLEVNKNKDGPKLVDVKQSKDVQTVSQFVPVFNSREEDLKWASAGMVATLVSGESAVALQQKVEDAGFSNLVVIPMGGDRVLYIVSMGKMCGMFSTRQEIFLACYSLILISGRQRMLGMNGGPGYVFTVFPFMLGMMLFSNFVLPDWADLSTLTIAHLKRLGWILHAYSSRHLPLK